MPSAKIFSILVVVVAVLFKARKSALVSQGVIWLVTHPMDVSIGEIPFLTVDELVPYYENKSALVVGGTRGTGFGTALVMAKVRCHTQEE